MVDPHAHPALVALEIIHAVRDGFAAGLAVGRDHEVMHAHAVGGARGTPRPAAILEVADEFLLLGVHRDRRLLLRLLPAHGLGDVPELGITIGVLPAFACLRLFVVPEKTGRINISL